MTQNYTLISHYVKETTNPHYFVMVMRCILFQMLGSIMTCLISWCVESDQPLAIFIRCSTLNVSFYSYPCTYCLIYWFP